MTMGTGIETLPNTAATPAATAPHAPPGGGGLGFGDVLSMLNPLQYVPVVGMIYRAVTGDTIPDPVRVAGSLAFSALTGGPVGVVLSAATEVAEEALDIKPDKISHSLLASLGLVSPDKKAIVAPTGAPTSASASAAATPANAPATAAAAPTPAADASRRIAAYAAVSNYSAPEPVIGAGG